MQHNERDYSLSRIIAAAATVLAVLCICVGITAARAESAPCYDARGVDGHKLAKLVQDKIPDGSEHPSKNTEGRVEAMI